MQAHYLALDCLVMAALGEKPSHPLPRTATDASTATAQAIKRITEPKQSATSAKQYSINAPRIACIILASITACAGAGNMGITLTTELTRSCGIIAIAICAISATMAGIGSVISAGFWYRNHQHQHALQADNATLKQ